MLALTAPGILAQGVSLRYHTQSDGLANLAVTAIVQAPDGRLWIGTENGLYRFDGDRIARVDALSAPLRSRHVSTLANDGQGGLWVGTPQGAFRLADERWEPVQAPMDEFILKQGQSIASLADGGALMATVDALYVVARHPDTGALQARPAFDAASLRADPSLARIHAVLVERDGSWWMGCGNALCHWRGGHLEKLPKTQGDAPWAGLRRTADGALWVRSRTKVLRMPPGATDFQDVTPPGLSHGVVRLHQPIVEDGDGRVLTPSDTGLLRWEAGQWTFFGAAQGLEVAAGLQAILVDRQQDVWLGTAGLGLGHWRGYRHWRSWTRQQGLPSDDVWTFAEDTPAQLWIGTSEGSALRSGQQNEPFARAGGTDDQVGSIAKDARSHLWMGTYSGQLFRRRSTGQWQRVASELPVILLLEPVAGGGLWVGTDKGLLLLDDSELEADRPKLRAAPGLGDAGPSPTAIFTACTSVQGLTWFGTSAGLRLHDPQQGIVAARITDLPANLGIEKLACGRDGTLWAASRDHRLWRIVATPAGGRAEPLHAGEVLGRRSVMGLMSDHRGWLWVTTDDGVVVWNGRQWRRFDDSNGLVWNDCNQNAIYEDTAGDVWIGTSRGASQVVAPEQLFAPVNAELRFTAVSLDGQALAHDRAWTVDWSPGSLHVSWFVPTMSNRSAQRVRYRMLGLSEAWSVTPHGDIRFAALPAGRYVLEAQAENVDLGTRSGIARLEFTIRPPWWQSAWALAAYACAAALLLTLVYRWRVGLLVRRQRELELLVGERTADLEASYQQMRELALTDPLTGAMNRRALTDRADRELARARRHQTPVSFVILDVDHFKTINDTHGHPAGDAVLSQLVQRLRAALREHDIIGRWGGEEFVLVLPGLSVQKPEARDRVERLRQSVSLQPFDIGTGSPLVVTVSAGAVAAASHAEDGFEMLIGRADAALYEAKHGGRNQTVFV